MTSKWIDQVYQLWLKEDGFAEIEEVLVRVDELLRQAMLKVDDDQLQFSILNELENLNVSIQATKTGRIMTGVSSVVPVTDAEAERIFNEVANQEEERTED